MSAERSTRQRRTIREVVELAGRPLSTDEILAGAHASIPSLGRATVYRSIRALLDEGWLTSVDVPGRTALYERAGKDHHHHFECSVCRRVYELAGCASEIRGELPAGFVAAGHDVTIYGACESCSSVKSSYKPTKRVVKILP